VENIRTRNYLNLKCSNVGDFSDWATSLFDLDFRWA